MINIKLMMDEGLLSDEQYELVAKTTIEWQNVTTRNSKMLIESVVHDEDDIAGVSILLTDFNPVILGGWKVDGLPINLRYETVNVDGEYIEQIVSVLDEDGNPIVNKYPFMEQEYLELMPDLVTYNDDGSELSTTRPTSPEPLVFSEGGVHQYLTW